MSSQVQYPSFYDPTKVGKVFRPNIPAAVAAGVSAGWAPAARDGIKTALFIVDAQIDFCFPDGALPVPGAVEDISNINHLILTQGDKITTIAATMDTHSLYMIFFSTWWVGPDGKHPDPFTIITEKDIQDGAWRAVINPAWSHAYVSKLAEKGNYPLMIWPFHCMDGSEGFDIVPALYEVMTFHAAARYAQLVILHKGMVPQTEHYSPLEPEVEVPGVIGGGLNTDFLTLLAKHDRILVVGEAKSHCVLSAMNSLVAYFGANQPDVLRRVYFLVDCTSSVEHPDVPFDEIANQRLAEMQQAHGIQLVKSTEISL